MNIDEVMIEILCYSEETGDSIGCGVFVSSKDPSPDEIDVEDIMVILDESFWELLSEFECSAQTAFDDGVISGTDYDELFKVFGHFHFSCSVDGNPMNINLGIDPDEYMYTRLVEYLVINGE